MSDLIDLDTSTEPIPQPTLAAPLLPCPDDSSDTLRPSLGPADNPFDFVTREVNRYIRRSMDPFEAVLRAEPKKPDITSTDIISNSRRSLSLNSLTNPVIPEVAIIVDPPDDGELSILNESILNDALTEEQLDPKNFLDIQNHSKSLARRCNSFLGGGFSNSFSSNCSSIYSGSSDDSNVLNRAFILSDRNGFLNSSSSNVNLSKFEDLGNNKKTLSFREDDLLVNVGNARRNDSFIVGNFGGLKRTLSDVNMDKIADEAKNVSKAINSMFDFSQDNLENISTLAEPDFSELPPSDDEADLISISPSTSPKTPVETVYKIPCEEKPNIVKEVESEVFGLTNPKTKLYALTRIVELKNLVKINKPEMAKLLDELASVLGLNCDNNAELLATCLQNSNEEQVLKEEEQIVEKEKTTTEVKTDKIEEPIDVQSIFANLKKLFQESPTISSPTRDLLQNLGTIFNKISAAQPSPAKTPRERSRSEVRTPRSQIVPRRSFTPDGLGSSPKRRPSLNSSREQRSLLKPKTSLNTNKFYGETSINKLKDAKTDIKSKQIPEISVPKTKLVTDIKSKLKRKTNLESVAKKGPMKAIIPVNSMQKLSVSKTASPAKTAGNVLKPPKISPMATSTPIVRRSFAQVKPRRLDSSNKNESKMSPRRSRLRVPSPMKLALSPKRASSQYSKSPKSSGLAKLRSSLNSSEMRFSPLATKNQNIQSRLSVPRAVNFPRQAAEKENQNL